MGGNDGPVHESGDDGDARTVALGLTEKQSRFVDQYLVDGNATAAAVRAGYSAKSARTLGSRLLAHPAIAAALVARRADVAATAQIDASWVISRLRLVVDRCLQAVPVRDRSGGETGEWTFHATAATRALELIGKYLGLFSDRIDVQLLRQEAAQVAAELGLNEQEVLSEAEGWLKSLRRRQG